MLQFNQVQPDILNLETGEYVPNTPYAPEENEIETLKDKGYTLEEVLGAIEASPAGNKEFLRAKASQMFAGEKGKKMI